MSGDTQFLTNQDGSLPDLTSLPTTSIGQNAKNAVDRGTRALLVKSVEGSSGSPIYSVEAQPSGQSYTDGSGTIATGGASQQVFAAKSGRRYFFFLNISDTDMWINFGVAAVANQPSIKIAANGFWEPLVPSGESVHVFCATTGKAFVAKEA